MRNPATLGRRAVAVSTALAAAVLASTAAATAAPANPSTASPDPTPGADKTTTSGYGSLVNVGSRNIKVRCASGAVRYIAAGYGSGSKCGKGITAIILPGGLIVTDIPEVAVPVPVVPHVGTGERAEYRRLGAVWRKRR